MKNIRSNLSKSMFNKFNCLVIILLLFVNAQIIKTKSNISLNKQIKKSNSLNYKSKRNAAFRKDEDLINFTFLKNTHKNKNKRLRNNTLTDPPVNENCVRFYDKEYLQGEFKDFCQTNDEIINETKKRNKSGAKYSIMWNINSKALFEKEDLQGFIDDLTLHFEGNTVNSLPFKEKSIFYLIKKGEVALFDNSYFRGKRKTILNSNSKIDDFQKNPISSFIIGNNTLMLLTNKEGKKLYYTTSKELGRFSVSDYIDIEISELDNSLLPSVNPNCSILFSTSIFELKEQKEINPEHICSNILQDDINSTKYKENSKKQEVDKKNQLLAGNINAVVNGEGSTVVFFDKPYLKGIAFPIKNYIWSSSDIPQIKDSKSVTFVNEGCVYVFIDKNFANTDSAFNSKRFCYSINDISASWMGKSMIQSIIIPANTSVELYSSKDYKGEKFRFDTSISNLYPYTGNRYFLSIKILTHNKEIKMESLEGSENCFMIYKEANYKGDSDLVCEDLYQDPKDLVSINSIKIPENLFIILYYKADLLIFFDQFVAKPIISSVENLDNSNIKFLGFSLLKKGCAVFFEEEKFSGAFFQICISVHDLSLEIETLSKYNSVMLGKSTEFALYDNINFEGNKTIIDKNIEKLSSHIQGKIEFKSIEFFPTPNVKNVYYSENKIKSYSMGLYGAYYDDENEFDVNRISSNTNLENLFDKCFIEENLTDIKDSELESTIEFNNNHKGLYETLATSSFIKGFKFWYCSFKNSMADIVIKITELISDFKVDKSKVISKFTNAETKQSKRFVSNNFKDPNVNGTPTKRKLRLATNIKKNSFKAHLTSVFEALLESAQNFGNYLVSILDKVKDKIKEVIFKLMENFVSSFILKLLKVLYCVFDENKKKKITKVINKIKLVMKGISLIAAGIGVFIMLEVIFAQLCEFKKYLIGITYITLANKKNLGDSDSKLISYLYNGLGAGYILRSFSDGKSVVEELSRVIEEFTPKENDKSSVHEIVSN